MKLLSTLAPVSAKAVCTIGIIATLLIPKTLYWTSDKYIRIYNTSSSYLSELKESTLNTVGLQSFQPEVLDENLESMIKAQAINYKLNPKLLKALIHQESTENADALSLKGAIGYGQIMPANAKRCGLKKVSELWDTAKNIKCSAQILSEELTTSKGDLEKALFSYNGGPLAYTKKYSESVNYSAKILKNFAQSSVND